MLQMEHQSLSRKSMLNMMEMGSRNMVLLSSQSFTTEASYPKPGMRELYLLPAGATQLQSKQNLEPPIRVYNDGTQEWVDAGLDELFQRIDFVSIARNLLASRAQKRDSSRGTIAQSIGYTDGENQRRDREQILNHYGCAMNQILEGTEEYIRIFAVMADAAKILGLKISNETECELFADRHSVYGRFLCPAQDEQGFSFEGITLILNKVFPSPAFLHKHVDHWNCSLYPEVLTFNCHVVLVDPGEFGLYKVGVVAYMRKACFHSMLRRNACKETATIVKDFMNRVDPGLLPSTDYTNYFRIVGTKGMALLVRKPKQNSNDYQILSAALMTAPGLEKGRTFISSITDALRRVYVAHPDLSLVDLISLTLPVCHLSSIFGYVSVLRIIAREPVFSPSGDLGYLETLLLMMNQLCNGYSKGKWPRCKVFWNKNTIDKAQFRQGVDSICDIIFSQDNQEPVKCSNYLKHCRNQLYKICERLTKQIFCCGEFAVGHLVLVLVQLRLLKPTGMAICARFALSTSNLSNKDNKNQKKRLPQEVLSTNQCLKDYLQLGYDFEDSHKKDHPSSARRDRARRVMESVQPHLAQVAGHPGTTDEVVENGYCESLRKMEVYDFYFPGSWQFAVHPWKSLQTTHCITPYTDNDGWIRSKSSPYHQFLPSRDYNPTSLYFGSKARSIMSPTLPAVGDDRGDTVMISIPSQALFSFKGLMELVRGVFFQKTGIPFDEKRSLGILEQDDLVQLLIAHFVKKPARSNKFASYEVEHLCPERFSAVDDMPRTAHEAYQKPPLVNQRNNAGITPNGKEEPSTKKAQPKRKLPPANPPLQLNTQEPVQGPPPPERVLSRSSTTDNPHTSPSIPLFVDETDGDKNQLHPMVINSISPEYNYLYFPNSDYLSGIVVDSALAGAKLTSSKVMEAKSSGCRIEFGSLFTEVMHAINSPAFPTINKQTLKMQELATGEFSCSLDGLDTLPFQRTKHCALVDRIGVCLGGKEHIVTSLKYTVWTFDSPHLAQKHLMISLLLKAGKIAWFNKLVARTNKSFPWKEDQGFVAVQFVYRTRGCETPCPLFYAFLERENKVNKTDNQHRKQEELNRFRLVFPCNGKTAGNNCHFVFVPSIGRFQLQPSDAIIEGMLSRRHRKRRRRANFVTTTGVI